MSIERDESFNSGRGSDSNKKNRNIDIKSIRKSILKKQKTQNNQS